MNFFQKIKEIESNKQKTLLNEKKFIGRIVLYSILLYILIAIVFFFIPNNIVNPLLSGLLLLVIPIMLVI